MVAAVAEAMDVEVAAMVVAAMVVAEEVEGMGEEEEEEEEAGMGEADRTIQEMARVEKWGPT